MHGSTNAPEISQSLVSEETPADPPFCAYIHLLRWEKAQGSEYDKAYRILRTARNGPTTDPLTIQYHDILNALVEREPILPKRPEALHASLTMAMRHTVLHGVPTMGISNVLKPFL